jgi:hypothetical protein
MHCPNCGTRTSPEQKFCRNCGLSLERVVELLDELAPGAAGRAKAALAERQHKAERWLGIASLVFVSALLVTIISAVVYGLIGRGEWLKGMMLLFLILSAAAALGLVFYNESLKGELTTKAKPPARPEPDTAQLPAPEPTARLLPESRLEPVPSVTERTTDLLTAERKPDRRGSKK